MSEFTPKTTHFKQGCCKCGYYIEVFLAANKDATLLGWEKEAIIQCPNCKEYNHIKSF